MFAFPACAVVCREATSKPSGDVIGCGRTCCETDSALSQTDASKVASSLPARKDPNAPVPTPLERHLADVAAQPIRPDGSDKYFGFENVSSSGGGREGERDRERQGFKLPSLT